MHKSIYTLIKHNNLKSLITVSDVVDDLFMKFDGDKQAYTGQFNFESLIEDTTDLIHIVNPSIEYLNQSIDSIFRVLHRWGVLICSGESINIQLATELSKRDDIFVHFAVDEGSNLIYITRKMLKRVTGVDVFNINDWEDHFNYNRYVILGMAKLESKYIYDWCEHHLNLGIDKVILYDNNDLNGETYDEILKTFIDAGQVEIRNIRGLGNAQRPLYEEFYYSNEFGWCMVIDCDEFFTFTDNSPYSDIKSYLDRDPSIDAVMTPWICHTNVPHYFKGKITDWNNPMPQNGRRDGYNVGLNAWMKTTYRHGSNMGPITEHAPWGDDGQYTNYNIIDESGDKVPFQLSFHHKYNVELPVVAYLKHYLVKDIETFFYTKYLRGHAGLDNTAGLDGYMNTCWIQNLNYYLEMNRCLNKYDQEFLLKRGFKIDIKYRPSVVILVESYCEDEEYYSQIMDMLKPCCANYDTQVYGISANTEIGYNALKPVDKKNFKFQFNYSIHSLGMDLPKYPLIFNSDNWFMQEPIIIHIGYPRTDKDKYLESLRTHLFEPKIFENICRDLTFFNEGKKVGYVCADSVINDDNCAGWKELVTEVASNHHLTPTNKAIKGNTFITNASTFAEITSIVWDILHSMYPKTTQDLLYHIEQGYSTPYQAAQFTYTSNFVDLHEI